MVKLLRKIAFVIEEFSLGGPAQQLLDRYLMGYPCEGAFRKPEGCQLAVRMPPSAPDAELRRRERDFGLTCAPSLAAAAADADGLVIVPKTTEHHFAERLIKPVLELAATPSSVFVYGTLGETLQEAKQLAGLATGRKVAWFAATATSVTWRLPDVDVPAGTSLADALIVVQGGFPEAEMEALNGLFPVIERRRHGETGVHHITLYEGPGLWPAGERKEWSWPLLAAALSRSDSPQGDPVRDGRTQDLVGLGLVPKLATAPRGWILQHADGLRSAILVLDGVIADFNFAVQTRGGQKISAQLYRPPVPEQHQFSRLAGVLEEFFRTGRPPGPPTRGMLTAQLLEAFATMRNQGLRQLQLK